MRTLLFAAILYLVGIVAILLLRPSIMFDEQGQWKEFGTIATDHTIFPFWLFCIAWSAISYCITLFFMDPAETSSAPFRETELPEDLVMPMPSKKKKATKHKETEVSQGNMKPGYYILDSKELKKSGVPKYIYMGDNDSKPIPVGKEESDSE